MKPGSADEVVRGLYEAASTLADDRPALDALRDWIGAEHVVLFEEGQVRVARTCSHLAEITPEQRSLGMIELVRLRKIAKTQGCVFRHSQYIDRAEQQRTPFFRDFLQKYDGGPSAGAHWASGGSMNTICIGRSLRAVRDFRDHEIGALQAILPHVSTAQAIRQNLRRANQIAVASGMAMGRLQQALFLVDPAGQLAYQNDLADELLAARDGFRLTRLGLTCDGAASASKLARAVDHIRRLTLSPPSAGETRLAEGTFSVPRPGRTALRVTVVPVTGLALLADASLDPGWVAVMVSDPQWTDRAALSRLVECYGLTPRESQLVHGLVSGLTLPGTAADLGITHETARQYLKAIFGKTGVNRQAELIRLASRLSG